MLLCEFCTQYRKNAGECRQGLRIPKRMACREFEPSVERFCSDPADFVNEAQLVQMAGFFDIKGAELKKIRAVAVREETRRADREAGVPGLARYEALAKERSR